MGVLESILLGLWLGKPVWMWLVFLGIVLALLVFDLGVLHRDNHDADNPVLKFIRARFNVTDKHHGESFFVKEADPRTGKLVWFMTPLFLALAAMVHRFHYLKHALALVLVFIGSKIFLAARRAGASAPSTPACTARTPSSRSCWIGGRSTTSR